LKVVSMKSKIIASIQHQSGVVMLVSLIMLLLLTIIGLTGSKVTGLEEKMAGNMRDKNLAFQAAESALKEGEAAVTNGNAFNCTNGRFQQMDINCDATKEATPAWEGVDWAGTKTVNTADDAVLYSNGDLNLDVNPAYIIEDMGLRDADGDGDKTDAGVDQHVYRVTARATGGSLSAVVILQSVVEVPV
jgi:type IV pilus assembly protein PilX